jgi:uncharacterized membrane protein
MNTGKSKYATLAAGLVVITTAILLGAVVTLGKWHLILVMVAAAVWFAKIAFEDRPLTAEEKQNRAHLRRTMP